MSKRWFVHRNNQAMGPWTADTVRAALREGTIDPFDLVNTEGSPIMRELVEVDEIFQPEISTSKETPSAQEMDQTVLSSPKKVRGGILALAEPNIEKRIAATGTNVSSMPNDASFLAKLRGKEKTRVRAPQAVNEGNVSYDRAKSAISENVNKYSDPKRYVIIDKRGRVLGPMSAGDIQSLYYRGVLDASTLVRKNESEATVSVVKFVEVYAQAKGGGQRTPVIAAHPIAFGNGGMKAGKFEEFRQTTINNLNLLKSSKRMIFISILSLIVSTGFGLYSYQNSVRSTRGGKKGLIINGATKRSAKRNPGKDGAGSTRGQSTENANSPIKEGNRPRGREKSLPQPVTTTPPAVTPKPPTATYRPPNRRPLIQTPPRVAVVAPLPPQKAPAVAIVAPPPPSPIAALAGKDGQLIKIGTLRFRLDDLNRCQDKCELTMSDASGRTIVAKFFKDSFGTRLQGKSNGAIITGKIMDNGQAVLLTDVQ